MKVIIGDIKDAMRSGQIRPKDYYKIKEKSRKIKEPAEPVKEKGPNLIRESLDSLRKTIEQNNSLTQSAINLMQEISENLKKEPPKPPEPWDKIHVDVKRNKDGKIKSVEMKRKD